MSAKLDSARAKTAVRCTACRSIFTAEVDAEGDVFLIGVGAQCTCGGTQFQNFA